MRGQRLAEQHLGLLPVPERGVQLPEVMGVRAHEADQRTVDRARRPQRAQVVEQPAAQVAVAQRDRRGRELAHEHRPQVGPVGPPVLEREHRVQLAPRALAGRRRGRGSRPRWRGRGRAPRPTTRRPGRGRPELVGQPAGPRHLQPLGHPDVAGVGVADGLTELGRLDAEPVAAVDVAVQQRQRGLPGQQEVVVARLAQVAGDGGVLAERGPERRRPALELGARRQQQPLGQRLPVAAGSGQRGDLAGDLHPAYGGAGRPEAVVLGEQAAGQGRPDRPAGARIATASSASGRARGPIGRHRVLQLPGQGRGHPGRGRPVRRAQRLAGRLEHTHEPLARHREPRTAPVQAERDGTHQLTVVELDGRGHAASSSACAAAPRRPSGSRSASSTASSTGGSASAAADVAEVAGRLRERVPPLLDGRRLRATRRPRRRPAPRAAPPRRAGPGRRRTRGLPPARRSASTSTSRRWASARVADGQVGQHGLAVEVVGEPELHDVPGQDAGVTALAERRRRLRPRVGPATSPSTSVDRADPATAATSSRPVQSPGQRGEASPDDVADGRRDAARVLARGQRPAQLAREERVARAAACTVAPHRDAASAPAIAATSAVTSASPEARQRDQLGRHGELGQHRAPPRAPPRSGR